VRLCLNILKFYGCIMPDICGKCSLIPRPPGEVGGGAGDEAMVRGSTQQYVTILKKFVDRIITT